MITILCLYMHCNIQIIIYAYYCFFFFRLKTKKNNKKTKNYTTTKKKKINFYFEKTCFAPLSPGYWAVMIDALHIRAPEKRDNENCANSGLAAHRIKRIKRPILKLINSSLNFFQSFKRCIYARTIKTVIIWFWISCNVCKSIRHYGVACL